MNMSRNLFTTVVLCAMAFLSIDGMPWLARALVTVFGMLVVADGHIVETPASGNLGDGRVRVEEAGNTRRLDRDG